MRSTIRVCITLLTVVIAAPLFGQSDAPPVQFVLYPAAEARPALKYQLLPPFLERRPGNAAVWWNRVPAERTQFFATFYAEGGPWEKIEHWMQMPLGSREEKQYREKELSSVGGFLSSGNGIYADMERAARFESCDWEQPVRDGNYIMMLLPEIQQSRSYARLLSAKAHFEIAEGRYAAAVRTLQTGYSEGRQVAQSPTIVSGLVGVTIAGIMSYQLQQFIQQPDAPNLYWALSILPRPLVDFRINGEAESNILYLQYPELRDLDKKNFAPDEWTRRLNVIIDASRSLESSTQSPILWRTTMDLSIIEGYPRAKRYLIEHGYTPAKVEAMPVAQVVLLYSVKVYDELSDDQFKWFFLPAAEVGDSAEREERRLRGTLDSRVEIIPFAEWLVSATRAAKNAETRCQWGIEMLRVFEAMRLYAAGHDGRWPDRLSDITNVPIPMNPYDGKPFLYERSGDRATLTSEKGPPNQPWRYEITLKPKK